MPAKPATLLASLPTTLSCGGELGVRQATAWVADCSASVKQRWDLLQKRLKVGVCVANMLLLYGEIQRDQG